MSVTKRSILSPFSKQLCVKVLLLVFMVVRLHAQADYVEYHHQTIEAEELISLEKYELALNRYNELFENYDFVFLRDAKIAAQLALQVQDTAQAFDHIRRGMKHGWQLKAVKKNSFLKPLRKHESWKVLEKEANGLADQYEQGLNGDLRKQVHEMYKKDQKKAMGALLRIGNKAQESYGSEKFAPHSEIQMKELNAILDQYGYPGEKLIGNNYWMSTVISHHNSISKEYVANDTIYSSIRPVLIHSIQSGEISPFEFALIDDWKKAVVSERSSPGYGYLNAPKSNSLLETNALREKIGLRSVELRNALIDVEQKTGMNIYLPDWVNGKITIESPSE